MKAFHIVLIAGAAGLAAADAQQFDGFGEIRPQPREFRDAATHQSLVEAAERVSSRMEDPIGKMQIAEVPEEVHQAEPLRPQSLLARSEVLCRGEFATLVPKQAVLCLPESHRGLTGLREGVRLISWDQFFNMNRSWIRTYEVSRNQAEGLEPLPEETVQMFQDAEQIIIATYQSGPISVLPLQVPVDPLAGATAEK